MGTNRGFTYVKDFDFPAEQGFSGSAGKDPVKGYMRGGHVKSPDNTKGKGKSRAGMPPKVKAKGGPVKKQLGGIVNTPGAAPTTEIAVDDVAITVPKMRGGAVHNKLRKAGAKMGYAYGGAVKDTSGEFKEKRGKQDTMDNGVQPARRGANARNQAENEAGGTGRLKPGLKRGGPVKMGEGGKFGKPGDKYPKRKSGPAGRQGKSMPKNVKARGGLAEYSVGGVVQKAPQR